MSTLARGGKLLTTRGTIVNDDQVLYRAIKVDCTACTLKFDAARRSPFAKSRAVCTSGQETWPAPCSVPNLTNNPDANAKRSECCSRSSSALSA
jgi:hypothetical protein